MIYREIIELFEDFATAHPDLKRFKSDTQDRINDFIGESETLPLMYISYVSNQTIKNVAVNYKYKTISFLGRILVERWDNDNLPEDNNLVLNQTNQNLEQTLLIAELFEQYLNDYFEELSFNISPLNNFGFDGFQGVEFNFTFEIGNEFCIKDVI